MAKCDGCEDRTVPPPTIVKGIPICPPCCGEYERKTVPVGSFPANPFGLYDMLGNVAQWTEDCANQNYNGAPTDGSPWVSGDCGKREVRVGDWAGSPWMLRSARRGGGIVTHAANGTGFRVAKTLP
jgi:formylglycine-generating enzyme required for sulfatase activity